ncbi:MAG: RNA methyltransferase [Acholeplasmataceae bacterium]|nr:RNA methyltransferase [Acholeplasmataceae bacterium]
MITSKQNPSFKLMQKLKLKKYRDAHDLFLVYGAHLIEKAKEKDAVQEILTSHEEKEGTLISLDLMKELNQTETLFDSIAICKKTNHPISSNKILMLDDVQDPDNVGALIRSAAAFGFHHLVFSLKTADLYNEKVIRASKGSIFDVFVERKPLVESIVTLKKEGYQLVYADAHKNGKPIATDKLVLILGNEGQGINKEIKQLCDTSVHIQTKQVESLNVSVAGGILMHQWRDL